MVVTFCSISMQIFAFRRHHEGAIISPSASSLTLIFVQGATSFHSDQDGAKGACHLAHNSHVDLTFHFSLHLLSSFLRRPDWSSLQVSHQLEKQVTDPSVRQPDRRTACLSVNEVNCYPLFLLLIRRRGGGECNNEPHEIMASVGTGCLAQV